MNSNDRKPLTRPDYYRVNLTKLQDQCEKSYAKITQLLPELKAGGCFCLSLRFMDQHGTVFFNVIEKAPYTTLLDVQLNASWGQWLSVPFFRVRIYHDLRMAEMVSMNKERHFKSVYPYPNKKMRLPDEKEQLNTLLSEWLTFCLKHGYSIEPVTQHDS